MRFLQSIALWIRQQLWSRRFTQAAALPPTLRHRPRNILALARWEADGESAPALHWVPCHAATAARFKATIVCDRGHASTLKQHAVDEQGAVWPSVVCSVPGCEFHRYVQLDDWTGETFE